MSEKELEIEAKKKKLDENTDEKYEISNTISTLTANAENAESRKKAIKEEIASNISELDSSRMTKSEISQKFAEIEARRNKIKGDLESIENERKVANEKLRDFNVNINQSENEMRIKDSRLKFLIETEKEKEGYIRSVKSILKDCEKDAGLRKGVHGVIANLISVPKDYETAIEMALGQTMQNIVTDTEEDAKRLVEHLRKFNLGRASFLPISSVNGKKVDKIKAEKGVIGVASDLVKYDKKYEGVILNLLGRTVIVDNMDNAIAIARKNSYGFRIVTIDGDTLNPSGAISGGSVSQKTVNILGRSREIDDLKTEIESLQKRIEKLKAEKKEYEESIESTLDAIEVLDNQLKEAEIVYATEKQKVVSIEESVSKVEARIDKLKEEEACINEQLRINVETQEELKAKIASFEAENESLGKEINEFAEANKDTQKIADDLNFDITNLKISVSSFDESEASIDELVERINLDIENIHKSIENKNEQKTKILEDNEVLVKDNVELEGKINELIKQVSSSGQKVEELKQERTSKNEKLIESEENLTSQTEKIDGLKEQINKSEVKKSKLEFELEQIVSKMWDYTK